MASRFLLRAAALSARGHRHLAGQFVTPPLAGPASIALAGQGHRHFPGPSGPRSSLAELVEAMRNMEGRLDALEANRQHSKQIPASKSRWVPPEAGWVKTNVDACFAREIGEATTGVVVGDERGGVILSALQQQPDVMAELPACSSKEEARLAACKDGLELALKYAQAERAILESDSAACIDALTRTCRDPSRLPAINQEAKGRIRGAQVRQD